MAPLAGQLAGGWYVSILLSSGLTVASNDLKRDIAPSEVSSIVHPVTSDERLPLKATEMLVSQPNHSAWPARWTPPLLT